jgi:hypothetical protein
MAAPGPDAEVEEIFYEQILPHLRGLSDAQIADITKKLLEYQINALTQSGARAAVATGMVLTGWTRDNPLVPKISVKGTQKRIQGSQHKQHSTFDSDLAYGKRVGRIERMLIGKSYAHVARPAAGPGVDDPISRETGMPIVFF